MTYWAIKLSLFINYFIFAILLNSVGTVILQVQRSYQISESAASILEAFKDLPIAITSFLVASFVARIGYKRSMLVALGFIGCMCMVMPHVPTFWMTKLLFAAIGVGFALIKVSVFATLGLVTNDRKAHVSLMNFLESFFMVGVLSGYFMFSGFVDDLNPVSTSWLKVYYLLAAISFAAFALLWFAKLDESGIAPDNTSSPTEDFTGMMRLCIKPLVLIFVVCAFLYVLIEQSIMTWLPTFNSKILNIPASLSIQMTSILALSTALGRFAAGFIFKWLDWFSVLLVGLLLAAMLVLVVLPLASAAGDHQVTNWLNAPVAAFVFPLIGFCIAPVYPAINSVILSALPARQHAPMAGLIVVFSALGGTTGSIITGTLFEIFGGKTAFYASLMPISALLFTLYLFKRHLFSANQRVLSMLNGSTPDQIYGELFEAVQSSQLFADSKTFVDATPKSDPAGILKSFLNKHQQKGFDLRSFVASNFELPGLQGNAFELNTQRPVRQHIELLWDRLTRDADTEDPNSSLIALPHSYLVPGGRFREIYYWDSYFTMLGLAASGRIDLVENMVLNFAFLIDQIGFIPNGNRTYYCTRSQPPLFALMVELLAEVKKDQNVYRRFLVQLEREYTFWMSGSDTLDKDQTAVRRVISVNHGHLSGHLNRYWDDSDLPRQESHAEDLAIAAASGRDAAGIYRDIRAACESGWDFSSRWLEDSHSMASIQTTQIVPVDLNAVMYKVESVLASGYRLAGKHDRATFFRSCADHRKSLIQALFFNEQNGFFSDLLLTNMKPGGTLSLAAAFPLFFELATPEQAAQVAGKIHREFLKPGGWVTTLTTSGQQWDAPNGWAPLQWIVYKGLSQYGYYEEAREGARRWVENNLSVYQSSGKLLEKYHVETIGLFAEGGEYTVQDGFGWTNGVLLGLLDELGMQLQ